jgi:hypothetical protein
MTATPPARHPLRVLVGRKIAPPRFLAFIALLPLAGWLHHVLFQPLHWTRSLAVGFDAAAAVFVFSLLPLLRESGPESIRSRADANDANRLMVLVVTSLLMVIVMAAISADLAAARNGDSAAAIQLVVSLLLIWLFANCVYALHYAHDFYTAHPGGKGDCGGLQFPEKPEPGYTEFLYFSFTLGMTFQTSDVAVTSTRLRGVTVLHGFAAFLFNIGVIAFTINALGGAGG